MARDGRLLGLRMACVVAGAGLLSLQGGGRAGAGADAGAGAGAGARTSR